MNRMANHTPIWHQILVLYRLAHLSKNFLTSCPPRVYSIFKAGFDIQYTSSR